MDTDLKTSLSDRSTWVRFLYMILFVLIFHLASAVVGAVIVVQFVLRLLTGEAHARLAVLGDGIGRYLHQIVAFLTFATDDRPYPYAEWPTGVAPPLPGRGGEGGTTGGGTSLG